VTGAKEGVRRAIMSDLPGLMILDQRTAGRDSQRVADLRRHIEVGELHIHVGPNGVDGYFVVGPRRFFGRDFVEFLFVAPAVRRSGLGTHLLCAALDLEGTPQVFTSTNQSNTLMRDLLTQADWQPSGLLEGLDDGDPELVFFRWRT
jgi:ribosomal protein S18 acetylase RimI-like enzyme